MAFLTRHLYLTIHWVPTGNSLETGQCGIRFPSSLPVTQSLVDSLKAPVQTMWTSVGAKIPIDYQLRFLRLADVGTDGKYFPGTFARDGVYGTGVSGGGSTYFAPLATACASTLVTAAPRGQAALGRIYLPPIATAPAADYRWTAVDADARSTAVASMLTAITPIIGNVANVMSRGTPKTPAGLSRPVTGVKTGRRPDVQRRRAKQLTELYGATIASS